MSIFHKGNSINDWKVEEFFGFSCGEIESSVGCRYFQSLDDVEVWLWFWYGGSNPMQFNFSFATNFFFSNFYLLWRKSSKCHVLYEYCPISIQNSKPHMKLLPKPTQISFPRTQILSRIKQIIVNIIMLCRWMIKTILLMVVSSVIANNICFLNSSSHFLFVSDASHFKCGWIHLKLKPVPLHSVVFDFSL